MSTRRDPTAAAPVPAVASTVATAPPDTTAVVAQLSSVDRFLPVWIGAAMVVGLLLGRLVPGLDDALDAVKVGQTSLPIAIGLLLMMYPVLAKVRYREIGLVTADKRMIVASLLLNWVIGPAVMFALAWLLLADQPAYRTGIILVGLARCIAMVLIWNDLACGDREMAAVLVALNAIFQVLTYAALGYFYLKVLPGWLGLETTDLDVSMWSIAKTVLIFLGIPLVAGYLTRTLGEHFRGQEWYETRLLPRIGPIALYGLLFTVVVLFALQGEQDNDREQQAVERDRPDPGQQPRLVPLLAAEVLAERAGEVPGDQWDAEEDQDGLGDAPHGHVQVRGLQPEPAGQHLEVEVAERGVGEDLEDRVEGDQDRGHLAVTACQVVPDQDHGDAPGQADQDDAGAVRGLVGQEQPGQGEHHRRADHPVQQQARRDHPLVRGDQADLAVAHLGEHRIHHQQQADGDRQRRLADLHRVE